MEYIKLNFNSLLVIYCIKNFYFRAILRFVIFTRYVSLRYVFLANHGNEKRPGSRFEYEINSIAKKFRSRRKAKHGP